MRHGRASSGQGSNSSLLGDFNERVILTALRRHGAASKADLARQVSLTNNAAGVIVRKLEASGLARPVGKRYGGRGQPATLIELNPDGAFAIGVRLDRDGIESVLVNLGGDILDRVNLTNLPTPATAVAHIADAVARFRGRLGKSGERKLSGIGVAMPFDIGCWMRDAGLPAGRFAAWERFDVATALEEATRLPVVIENDGTAAAIGEMTQPHMRTVEDFIYLFIGPFVGGGIVIGADYLRGRRGNAGDFGVIPVAPSRLPSAPVTGGPRVPLLARASLTTLVRHLAYCGVPIDGIDELDMENPAQADAYRDWRDDAVDACVVPVLAAAHLLDVDLLVLDGDLAPLLLDAFAARLSGAMSAATAEARQAPSVLRGRLGRDAAAVGAASLPFHLSFSPVREMLTNEAAGAFGTGDRSAEVR
jgi:predicted NBD/HSP70 family sugar kinase